jgi:hypothetical protein
MRILLLVVAVASVGASAADYKPLAGTYALGGKTVYDPPASEPKNTHIYFALEGKAARDLYESMKTQAVRDECANDGSMSKRVAETQCIRADGGKEYRCWFGIDIKTQKVVNGVVC